MSVFFPFFYSYALFFSNLISLITLLPVSDAKPFLFFRRIKEEALLFEASMEARSYLFNKSTSHGS